MTIIITKFVQRTNSSMLESEAFICCSCVQDHNKNVKARLNL